MFTLSVGYLNCVEEKLRSKDDSSDVCAFKRGFQGSWSRVRAHSARIGGSKYD